MIYTRKPLLFIVAAILLFFTAAIKETKGTDRSGVISDLFSSEIQHVFVTNHWLNELVGSPEPDLANTYMQEDLNGSENRNLQATDEDTGSQTTLERLWMQYLDATLKVRILVAILIYMVLSVLVLFISILINRQVKTNQRRRKKELKDEYQEQLANFLFDDEIERIEFSGINRKLNRQIFIDELMELHNNLHGEVAEKLKDLYFNLDLHKDSLNKVYKGRWDKKSQGFGELAQMDVKDANDEIREYVNSKNSILRMEAQVAMVKLSEDNPLSFLDNLENELSHWEQINIYDTLVYHQINIDSYEPWLENDNPSVVVFCLRMIGLFKHVHSAPKVRELLFHDNPEIALAAVQAMQELEISEYVEDMKMLYKSESLKLINILETQRKDKEEKDIKSLDDLIPRKIRYEIIKALQPIVSEDDVPFLEQVVLDEENSYKIRLLAISILISTQPAGEEKVNEMLNGDNELVKKMIINVKQNQES